VKDLKLTELCLPLGNTFSAQIIDKGLLARSSTHSEQRAQIFIEKIPFLLETVETAVRFFPDGLLYGEEIFVGEFLRGHEKFLRREVGEAMGEERRKRLKSGKWR
jgi:hypothetical protein